MKKELVKLSELFEIGSGGTPLRKNNAYYENGNIPWIKTGDLKTTYINNASEFITELGLKESSAKLFPNGTVLIAMYGATIGNCSILGIDAATNQACAAFRPTENVLPEYLYYYLISIKEKLISLGVGGAQPNISLNILKQIELPLIPFEEQQKIVATLNKSQELIKDRQSQIKALDELSQSVFLEFFGDPLKNTMEWEIKPCKEITKKIGSGATPKGGNASYKDSGISLIRSMNVHNNKFIFKNLAYIDEEQAAKLSSVEVFKNDILLNITGASVARSCIVPDQILPARVNQHVAIIRPDNEKVEDIFLSNLFTNTVYQKYLLNIATSGGATREAITKQQIEKMPIILPPLSIQNDFKITINRIESQKVFLHASLKELEKLYKSLIQKAFKSELLQEQS